jgi:hypothetical protein
MENAGNPEDHSPTLEPPYDSGLDRRWTRVLRVQHSTELRSPLCRPSRRRNCTLGTARCGSYMGARLPRWSACGDAYPRLQFQRLDDARLLIARDIGAVIKSVPDSCSLIKTRHAPIKMIMTGQTWLEIPSSDSMRLIACPSPKIMPTGGDRREAASRITDFTRTDGFKVTEEACEGRLPLNDGIAFIRAMDDAEIVFVPEFPSAL